MYFGFRRIGEPDGALLRSRTDGVPGNDEVNGDTRLRIQEPLMTARNRVAAVARQGLPTSRHVGGAPTHIQIVRHPRVAVRIGRYATNENVRNLR